MFCKSFPKPVAGSNYPVWEEIKLSPEEEIIVEKGCRCHNLELMKQCLLDARTLLKDRKLEDYEKCTVQVAMNLFIKRASHIIHWKELKAKEKFDKLFN